MFCKFCFDSNRPEYELHNLRDEKGNNCCPVLLNMKCYTCGLYGHTPKYCTTILKNSTKKTVKTVKTVKFALTVKDVFKPLPTLNNFAILCQEDNISYDDEFDISDIVWGKGLKSLANVSWADACGV